MPTYTYPHAVKNFLEGDIDLLADTIKLAYLSSAHTRDMTDEFWSDVSANEISADGDYAAGGTSLGTKLVTPVFSSSFNAWQASTTYAVGDLVRAVADNGHVFQCIAAGTSGGTEPSWDTNQHQNTADNTCEWVEFGVATVRFTFAADVRTSSGTLGPARFAVVYKDSGTPGTSPLIAIDDFGSDQSASGGGTLTYTPDPDGLITFGAGS